MSRKKMRSKADEFEMDEAGYDEEYGDAPAEQHIYDEASGAEPELRAPKVKKKKKNQPSSAPTHATIRVDFHAPNNSSPGIPPPSVA